MLGLTPGWTADLGQSLRSRPTAGDSGEQCQSAMPCYSMCWYRRSPPGRDGQLVKSAQPPGGWQAEGGAEAKL